MQKAETAEAEDKDMPLLQPLNEGTGDIPVLAPELDTKTNLEGKPTKGVGVVAEPRNLNKKEENDRYRNKEEGAFNYFENLIIF